MTNVQIIDVSKPATVEIFVNFLCRELKIKPSSITVTSVESDDCYGLCYDQTEKDYVIYVKEQDRNIGEIFTTIAHEMIHVKQYMKENLGWFVDNSSYIPYLERWWEKEAFSGAVPLVEKFIKTLQVAVDINPETV